MPDFTVVPEEISITQLAEFVSEGLCGLGVADDADELISYCYEEDGEEAARNMLNRYNNAILFINTFLPNSNMRPITEEEYLEYTNQETITLS